MKMIFKRTQAIVSQKGEIYLSYRLRKNIIFILKENILSIISPIINMVKFPGIKG